MKFPLILIVVLATIETNGCEILRTLSALAALFHPGHLIIVQWLKVLGGLVRLKLIETVGHAVEVIVAL